MRNTRRYLFAATAVAAIASALPAVAAERGGTLTIARPDEPLTLDPFIPADNGSIYAIAQICEPLVSADASGTGLEPGLAESWEVSDDGLTYTFKLREGVKFSDGTPVTVADAIFSLGKVANPEASYGFAFADVAKTEETDDGRLKVTLKRPNAAILSAMSLFAASIVVQGGLRGRSRPPSAPSRSAPAPSRSRATSAARNSSSCPTRTTGRWARTASRCPMSRRPN